MDPRPFFRKVVYAMAAAMVLVAALVLYVDGHLPARVPADTPALQMSDLVDALRSVDSRGVVDLAELKKRHASLERYVAALAAHAPDTEPDAYPTVEARLAYWLNAYHALTLLELMDTRDSSTSTWRESFHATPIGGKQLTRRAIFRHSLSQSGDGRVVLAVFTGAKGSGVLDGAPFDPLSLNPQLDDAARRFVRRRDHFTLQDDAVKLSELFLRHQADFLAALPPERDSVLQIVWAYLPDTCESASCETRSALDRACGPRFEDCTVEWLPVDPGLAVRN